MNSNRNNNMVMFGGFEARIPPTIINYKGARFLITDRPTENNILTYIEDLKVHNVKLLFRVCGPTYSPNSLRKNGIEIIDLPFKDGSSPPKFVVDEWLRIIKKFFSESSDNCVAIHCVSGLGRGPVLVAVALMELGLCYEDAIELIRSKRRGAINNKQLAFLAEYRAKRRLKLNRNRMLSCLNFC